MEVSDWVRQHGLSFGLFGLGAAFIGMGIVTAMKESRGDEVVVTVPPTPIQTMVVVDIGGAIQKPGVYTLPTGARVADLVATAGGFIKTADTNWINRTLNQAETLKDSQKIHIPGVNEESPERGGEQGNIRISINSASQTELEALWGVGEARAKQIIEYRPFGSLEELVTKAKLSREILEKNQGMLKL